MEDEYFWPWYINNLWQRENSIGLKGIEGKGGYKKGRYFPYTTPNGNVDLGPGFDMDKQDDKEFVRKAYAEGFTKEELDKIATERLKSENGYFNQRIIKEGGDPASIGRDVRAGLLDMYWQLKNGIYGYDEFWKAVANKDYKKMREESATYYEPKNGKYPKDAIVKDGKILDEGRWDYRKKKYFHDPSFRTGTTSRWAEGGFLKPKDAWDTLSLKEKAEMMKVAVKNGIYDLQTIRNKYNEFAEGGDTEPLEYTHQRFPVTQEFEIYPYKDPSFTPEGMGNIEYMEAKHDTLPYYNNYQKPSNLKGKSVVVYNNKMGDATNEAVALDILSHGLREQDPTWREKYLPTLTDAFEGDALYNMTDEDKKIYNPNDPEERGEVIDNYIDGYIRTMAVGDKYRKTLNYAPREVFNKEYNSLPPEQQNALAEAYSYIYPTQLPEVIVHGNKHSLGGTIVPITNIFKGGGYKPSTSVKKRISTWEGTAMTGAKDPLSGKRGKNRSFEAEADSFYDALPSSIRNQVLSNPNLADNLFSYSYNVGAGNFKKRVVPALERYYNGKGSAEEIANSMWASGDKKLRGLRKRRAVERKGVVDALSPAFMPQAADNTFMFNPYITQVENTQMLPIMVPDEDSYVTTHEVSPAEQKAIKFNAETEAMADYNRLMNTISILNNSQPEYTPANSIYTIKGLGEPIVEAAMNEYKHGGKIRIKPENRGKFTALKERTGHSATWFKEHGTPAQKKMAVFALNARKWKHGDGGNLYDGETQPTQQIITTGSAGYVLPISQKTIDNVISKVDNAIFKGSKAIMDYMSGFDGNDTDKRGESLVGIAQDTYLTPRRIQRKKFLDLGYTEVPGDYGLVRRAVGSRSIPVYQKNPDAITRDKLNVIGNTYLWEGSTDDYLNHAGSVPTAVYHDAEGNLYQKGWDLNDYGGDGGAYDNYSMGDKILANIADFVGSPTVVTTGYRPMYRVKGDTVVQQTLLSPSIESRDMINKYLKDKGLRSDVYVDNNGNLVDFLSLPEITVTGKKKKKKALGGNLFNGEEEDNIISL